MTTLSTLTPLPAGGNTGIPQHTDPRPTVTYAGPTMGHLISTKQLAHQIIACHHGPDSGRIFDSQELVFLRLYVEDPASGAELIRRRDAYEVQRGEGATGGGLVGVGITRGAFEGRSLEMLREW